ncbi:MAG: tetratricopeptide repeat protein, partial [Gammaproteobacteria bacterium]|nr:tetratricopeptide repeat protein [Gammaproteobacteria bacterium]NIR23651.1 tetratricopeptide repeat protein [Gammaproteobacteria bacterium]NIS05464.1 tetratricopeptide repeat protein [Gammaproteobacteria bacterium]NIU41848.1 tetratricopeptide repeat protein [Gammaproteobacteria bacterium]NIV47578.1 tetratricopeptide repeat protein [Gammaproteobacteria bacterium]
VYRNCVVCHRPGESAPFSLLSYAEAKKRAGLIAAVTASRYMPPWLPAGGGASFLGERGLSEEEIARIRAWVEQGAVEGDAADLPPPPRFTEGWQLGEPDMVVTMDTPFTVPADGVDVFRNFVLPIPVSTPRWVAAVELRPGNPRVVHHAVMQVDPSRSSRRRDEEDAAPGFSGMDMAGSEPPGGQLIGWTPGKIPVVDERLAWRLEPGSDLVLQLHMVPTGKPESVAPRVGLHFADSPPPEEAFSLLMRNDNIDIPAGDSHYVIEDSLTLPTAVRAVGIYPHAHYLGKSIEARARLPDGSTRTLIDIPKWDFNWQDDYRFAEPLVLPAGTTISMRFVYDNSSGNALNPHDPPERVRFGNRSSDEMATLTIQVLAERERDQPLLREALMRGRLEKNPDNWFAHNALGSALRAQGRLDEALSHIDAAIRLHPRHPQLRYNLGNALLDGGRVAEAITSYQQALTIEPDHPKAHNNLAVAFQQSGQLERAVHHYRQQLTVTPFDVRAHANLGTALYDQGNLQAADAAFTRALELDPEWLAALEGRGDVARSEGRLGDAERYYREALANNAASPGAHYGIGAVQLIRGEEAAAITHLRAAVEGNGAYLGVLNDDAWRLATHPDPAVRAPARALALATLAAGLSEYRVPELLDTLAAAQAATGAFPDAVETLQRALALAPGSSAAGYIPEFRERLALYRAGKEFIEEADM